MARYYLFFIPFLGMISGFLSFAIFYFLYHKEALSFVFISLILADFVFRLMSDFCLVFIRNVYIDMILSKIMVLFQRTRDVNNFKNEIRFFLSKDHMDIGNLVFLIYSFSRNIVVFLGIFFIFYSIIGLFSLSLFLLLFIGLLFSLDAKSFLEEYHHRKSSFIKEKSAYLNEFLSFFEYIESMLHVSFYLSKINRKRKEECEVSLKINKKWNANILTINLLKIFILFLTFCFCFIFKTDLNINNFPIILVLVIYVDHVILNISNTPKNYAIFVSAYKRVRDLKHRMEFHQVKNEDHFYLKERFRGKNIFVRCDIGNKDLCLNRIKAYLEIKNENSIVVVHKENSFFAGSIFENLLHYDIVRGERILKNLKLLASLEKFQKGVYTFINQEASCLSGGQRQRLATARALCSLSPIIFFVYNKTHLDFTMKKISFKEEIFFERKENDLRVFVDQDFEYTQGEDLKNDIFLKFENGEIYEEENIADSQKIFSKGLFLEGDEKSDFGEGSESKTEEEKELNKKRSLDVKYYVKKLIKYKNFKYLFLISLFEGVVLFMIDYFPTFIKSLNGPISVFYIMISFFVIYFLKIILSYWLSCLWCSFSLNIASNLHVNYLLSFLRKNLFDSSGKLSIHKLTGELTYFENLLSSSLASFITHMSFLCCFIFILGLKNHAFIFGFLIIFMSVLIFYRKVSLFLNSSRKKRLSSQSSLVQIFSDILDFRTCCYFEGFLNNINSILENSFLKYKKSLLNFGILQIIYSYQSEILSIFLTILIFALTKNNSKESEYLYFMVMISQLWKKVSPMMQGGANFHLLLGTVDDFFEENRFLRKEISSMVCSFGDVKSVKLSPLDIFYGDQKRVSLEEMTFQKGLYRIKGVTGKGKSTFLRALSGRHGAMSGNLYINGSRENFSCLKKNVSYVPQSQGWPSLMKQKNKEYIHEKRTLFYHYFKLLGCEYLRDKIEKEDFDFSLQDIFILNAIVPLVKNDKWILYDEPLISIDTNIILSFCKVMKKENKIVVIATHQDVFEEFMDESYSL